MALTTVLDGLYSRESYMYEGGWRSYENGVSQGEVRVINGILSYASTIYRRSWPRRDEILWATVKP
jgi:hypothetical protein